MVARGAWIAEVVVRLDRTLQSKTRDVPALTPHYGVEPVEMSGYRVGMHNAPAVQLLEDYIAYSTDRALTVAIREAEVCGAHEIAKVLANPRARCSLVIRLGHVEMAQSVDVDNVAKLVLDGVQGSGAMVSDQQVDTLRIDAAYSRRAAKQENVPTYVSIIKTRGGNLSFLESVGQHVGRAFVYPANESISYFRRYRDTLYPNADLLGPE